MSKVYFKDVDFLFAFRIDSLDRLENLLLVLNYICNNIQANICLLEAGPNQSLTNDLLLEISSDITYSYIADYRDFFYRTYYNNVLIQNSSNPYYFLYDTDIIVPLEQLYNSLNIIRKDKYALVYPYGGYFYEVNKNIRHLFSRSGNIDLLHKHINLHGLTFLNSYGGVVLINRKIYELCGGENVQIKGWGPDDLERFRRIRILGYKVFRNAGYIYHLFHERNKFSQPIYEFSNRKAYWNTCSSTRHVLNESIRKKTN